MAKLSTASSDRLERDKQRAKLNAEVEALTELEAVFAAERPALRRRIRQLVDNDSTAEDLVQETFLRAYGHLNSFRLGSNMRAWLFRIAANLAFDYHRRRRLQTLPLEIGNSQAHTSPGPEAQALSSERAGDIREALSRLPARARQAWLLAEVEGYSGIELARELGTTPATARNLLMRARSRLRQELRRQDALVPVRSQSSE